MAHTNESAVQRLQVGLVGLLVVLLFVSIASMILNRAGSVEKTVAEVEAAKTGGSVNGKAETEDPMVELGVTPVVPEQNNKQPKSGAGPQN
jgi:hypothetical protein